MNVLLPAPLGPTEGFADILELGDQFARTLTLGDGEVHLAELVATARAFVAQPLQTSHPAFVARAPRLDALADPHLLLRQHLVELGVHYRLGRQHLVLASPVLGVVAFEHREAAAIQFDDAFRHAVEKTPIVGHHHQRTRERVERLFQPLDRIDVEVVGRLVEQQQIRFGHECSRKRHSFAQTARQSPDRGLRVESESRQRRIDPRFRTPSVAGLEGGLQFGQVRERGVGVYSSVAKVSGSMVVVHDRVAHRSQPIGDGFEHCRVSRKRRFLQDTRNLEPRRTPDRPVVRRKLARDDREQRRLSRAVAPDEPDPIAALDDQARPVEQSDMAVGVTDGFEREERHCDGQRLRGRYATRGCALLRLLEHRRPYAPSPTKLVVGVAHRGIGAAGACHLTRRLFD
jgi:hypothetical protein